MKNIVYTLLIIALFTTGCTNAVKDEDVASEQNVTLDEEAGGTTTVNTSSDIAPLAVIHTSNTTIVTGSSVKFDASTSTDADGSIVSYTWKDGEGNTLSNQRTFTHTFTTSGEHSITLEVLDDDGQLNTASVTIVVQALLTSITLTIEASPLEVNQTTTLTAIAHYNDNTNEEVSSSVSWEVVDATLVSIDAHATLKALHSGTTNIVAYVGNIDSNSVNVEVLALDTTPPTLTLEIGIAYTELGVTTTDDKDDNVSIDITGNVDVNTVGTYTITYTAKDKAGNESTVTRTIHVVLPPDVTAPTLTLNGESTITLHQGTNYTELGATATDDKDANVTVNITGNVDVNTVGTYIITYTAIDSAGNSTSKERTVKIIDVTPPVITLNGEAKLTLEQNAVYTELGATAVDAVDGNVTVTITGNVDTSTVGSYTVTYTAQDNSSNESNVTRTITIVDVTPPVITFNGEANIILELGETYEELGASAVDNSDGNVSVEISGTVDTTTIGKYTLTYRASDSSANTASLTRTITVEKTIDPPTVDISDELNTVLSEVTVPYNRMTFEIATTSTETLTAVNTTLSQEQNRSIRVKGVDNNGTFYLYNIPLLKGENHIELNATNEAGVTILQSITVNADANLSVPIAMSAFEHEGIGSLTTQVTVLTRLNAIEYLFDSDGNGTIDETQTDGNFTVSYTKEGRYKPRVTIRTQAGLLYSSDIFELSLDVKATADQYDPVGATPQDVAKEFVEAFVGGDRRRVEQLLGENQRRIHAIYDNPQNEVMLKEVYSHILAWEQTYHAIDGSSSVRIIYELDGKMYEGGFEMNTAHSHGLHGGRKWFIRLFY